MCSHRSTGCRFSQPVPARQDDEYSNSSPPKPRPGYLSGRGKPGHSTAQIGAALSIRVSEMLSDGTRQKRRRIITGLITAALVFASVTTAPAPASAAGYKCGSNPSGGDGDLCMATFRFTGGEQVFDIPDGVTTLTLTVTGALGGSTQYASGGLGGVARIPSWTVPAGVTRLYVIVGENGVLGRQAFNGGGYYPGVHGINPGQAPSGGGSTDIRLQPWASTRDDTRIIVGGGGGAAGGTLHAGAIGGAGGDAGSPGSPGALGPNLFPQGNGGGGGGGLANPPIPGAGGRSIQESALGGAGSGGVDALGGHGGFLNSAYAHAGAWGGPGGGGYTTGGGGAASACTGEQPYVQCGIPGGGGGGSSYAPGGVTGTSRNATTALATITWIRAAER